MSKREKHEKPNEDLLVKLRSGQLISWRGTDEYGFPDRRYGVVRLVEENVIQIFDGGKLISFSKQELKTQKVRSLTPNNAVKTLNDRVSTNTLSSMLSQARSESYSEGESRAEAEYSRARSEAYERLPQEEKNRIRWEQERASDRLVN
ncbi:MAG: hypothetical protein A3H69_01495 [Candidatus Sungbacteria bacterium RIFCSPLOWO2_02_FULL_47_9]|uniref:Uncharacterized protein n=1 Tax=Candidatus Sungbacteria bacterium RIFCSPHIGHO2_01_FULL_47_32 TaxID=1802264 RepID=A0A1G2K5N8_9BACT|nr:MAG: hypothetical protein UX72_C0009G0046 [Parcubacteria group bacterium GW2011_GWA2_47_10]OGZ94695.1 MAG: hypothetical protein A2633_02630 [Candidatus Sungbacteria bacterium RIFCSPHIGHO2_01_FULL_47_32]OGZ99542.1 MAG: hypothetical protein A3D57_00340 [Candidatus Sungbacteria bacterium RIFCSPHIGHO2_02_FULL_46_12]OHA05207.1 MAG: hypothetical protein A3A28_01965 [Candidatus Sungbacteria bacterium RIFCSPLOWO2_01_FULL_47_32]OHA11816.1 MAG: hypothetical protein A3H69_01495 [Candidatus Sungbacteria